MTTTYGSGEEGDWLYTHLLDVGMKTYALMYTEQPASVLIAYPKPTSEQILW